MGTIEASYRREMNHNYMIINAPDTQTDGYECRMLAGNNIEGLLRFRQKRTETGMEFYYEITSRQPLSRLLEGRLISYEEIRELLLSAAGILRRTEEYLLKEEQILLSPDYIYVEPEDFSVFFCLVPGYSQCFPEEFTHLLQYILEKVNHQDHRSVVLAYGLYHESLKENYGMEDLLKYLSGVEEGKKKWEGFYSTEGREKKKGTEREEAGSGRTQGECQADSGEGWKIRENRGNGSYELDMEEYPAEEEEDRVWGEGKRKGMKADAPYGGRALERNSDSRLQGETVKEQEKDGGQKEADGFVHHLFRYFLIFAVSETAIYLMEGASGIRKYGMIPPALLAIAYLIFRLIGPALFRADKETGDRGEKKKEWLNGTDGQKVEWRKDKGQHSLYENRSGRKGQNSKHQGCQDRAERDQGGLKQPGQTAEIQNRPVKSRLERKKRDTGAGEGLCQGKKENLQKGRNREQEQEKEEWGFLFQSLEDESALRENGWEEKNTQLLSEHTESEEKNATLESTSRERESIVIPYVPFLIGKNSEMNDFVLDYPTVSRMHLRIDKKEKVYIFTDMNSTNGTTVNGYRMEANETVSVKEGDAIQIAGLGYRFREF